MIVETKDAKETTARMPILYRELPIEVIARDGAKPEIRLAISSETPVLRYGFFTNDYNEILDHSAGAIDMSRLQSGVAMLFNHNRSDHIGVVTSPELGADKVLRGTPKFSSSPTAQQRMQDVLDGTLRWVSVGYRVLDIKTERMGDPNKNEPDTRRVTRWEPVEVSLVTIPADPNVGIGRSDSTPTYAVRVLDDISNSAATAAGGKRAMENSAEVKAAVDQGMATERAAERARVTEIRALGKAHNFDVERFVEDPLATVASVNASILAGYKSKTGFVAPTGQEGSSVELVRDENDKTPKGIHLARFIRSIAATKGNQSKAPEFARDVFKDAYVARALAAGVSASGGFVVPSPLAQDVIEYLRPMTVVRSLNPVLAPLPNGALTMSKVTGGASASYIGENQDVPKTEQTFGAVKLSAKKLAAFVPISNDLIRYANISADTIVRDDLAAALAQAEDSAFIRNAGTAYSPKGLRYWAVSGNIFAANATINQTNTVKDLGKMWLKLRSANVRFLRPGWIISPRTENYLLTLLDGNGNYVFRAEMQGGNINRYPYRVTTLIPENLGGGSDESEIYFVDFADVVIGEVPTMVVEVSTEASYVISGSLYSAFSLDQTVIKMIVEHDLAVRHAESIAVMSTVKWA